MRDFLVGCALLLTVTAVAVAWNGIGGGGGGGGAAGPTGPTGPVSTLDCTSTVGVLHSCTVHLTSAAIHAFPTPFQLVAAAGNNTKIDPVHISVQRIGGTKDYCAASAVNVYLDPALPRSVVSSSGVGSAINRGVPGAGETGVFDSPLGGSDMVLTATANNAPLLLVGSDQNAAGIIATSTLGSGGSLYANGNTFNVDGGGDADAQGVVDTVGGGGAVLTYHLTNNGNCYPTNANPISTTATSGGGSGLTINVNTITTQGDGSSWITVDYRVIALH